MERRLGKQEEWETLSHSANTVVMISPDQFGFNAETAETNTFQNQPEKTEQVKEEALREFNNMAQALRDHGINVSVLPSREDVVTPDAVFPNNWFSLHENETLVIYPMLAEVRRAERQVDSLISTLSDIGVKPQVIDMSAQEGEGQILEGTGSLVLDRVQKIAYAIGSPRTSEDMFYEWCKEMDYEPLFFHAFDKDSNPIYHTNVILSIGRDFVVICEEAIRDSDEKDKIINSLQKNDRRLITITLDQVYSFCGNILELQSSIHGSVVILSSTAYNAFTEEQLRQLEEKNTLITVSIPTIEKIGGGSARCMLAEVFPSKTD